MDGQWTSHLSNKQVNLCRDLQRLLLVEVLPGQLVPYSLDDVESLFVESLRLDRLSLCDIKKHLKVKKTSKNQNVLTNRLVLFANHLPL